MSWFLIGLLVLAAIIIFWVIGIYNRLIQQRNQVKNAWSQIDVQLQRRYDLIPNLVETVKGYMTYEKSTLEAVIEARNQAKAARDLIEKTGVPTQEAMKQLVGAEAALKGGMSNIFALAENYPQLKASETMKNLQEELSTTENKVAFSRQAYNDLVMFYNTYQQEFPTLLFAQIFGHQLAQLFEIDDQQARKAVKVAF